MALGRWLNKQGIHQHLVIQEGESVQTNTDLQPKKSLSRKRILQKIRENDWNPFERVDGKLLEQLDKELKKQYYEDSPM